MAHGKCVLGWIPLLARSGCLFSPGQVPLLARSSRSFFQSRPDLCWCGVVARSTQIMPLCWHQAVAHMAQARSLCWREAVVRSFSPGEAGCSATEKSRWPCKLRLCRSLAQCSQVVLQFQCMLLPWPRACGSWGPWQVALQVSCSVGQGHVTLPA